MTAPKARRRSTRTQLMLVSVKTKMKVSPAQSRAEVRDAIQAAHRSQMYEFKGLVVKALPRVKKRAGHGVGDYLESDVSWVSANMDACVAFLKMMTGEK